MAPSVGDGVGGMEMRSQLIGAVKGSLRFNSEVNQMPLCRVLA